MQRKDNERESGTEFCNAVSGRLQKSTASDETGREVPAAGHLFCGYSGGFLEAEERGQGEAIARNLYEMSALKVPVLSIVIGEGGSGGALALAVADEVWMMENAVYSVLSPEGFASILWKDSKRASEAAGGMRLTAADLKELKVIEEIIREPEVYREDTMVPVLCELEEKMEHFLEQYGRLSEKQLTDRRYDRFRRM